MHLLRRYGLIFFSRYGEIETTNLIHSRGSQNIAFIVFRRHSSAENAVRDRHGVAYHGYKLLCEFARERRGTDFSLTRVKFKILF
jgi:RNA recognition motif-containing protein